MRIALFLINFNWIGVRTARELSLPNQFNYLRRVKRILMPKPPYYVVIFTNRKSDNQENYAETADQMVELAKQQPGFLGVDSFSNAEGKHCTISYWEDLEAIANWKAVPEHRNAQQEGYKRWYSWFDLKICKVEREYSYEVE